jgi:hypothetical protein
MNRKKKRWLIPFEMAEKSRRERREKEESPSDLILPGWGKVQYPTVAVWGEWLENGGRWVGCPGWARTIHMKWEVGSVSTPA